MNADIRNIKATIARTKKGTRAERDKARELLDWYKKDYPEYFPRGYFREPTPADFIFCAIEDDELFLIEIMADASQATIQEIMDQIDGKSETQPEVRAIANRLNLSFSKMGDRETVLLNECVSHICKMLMERRNETLAKIAEARRDPEMEALEKAAQFLDEYDRKAGNWRVSDLLKIRYLLMMTRDDVLPGMGHKALAKEVINKALAEARRRYAAGYYANPSINPPILRPVA
jgi:hypothetical protein